MYDCTDNIAYRSGIGITEKLVAILCGLYIFPPTPGLIKQAAYAIMAILCLIHLIYRRKIEINRDRFFYFLSIVVIGAGIVYSTNNRDGITHLLHYVITFIVVLQLSKNNVDTAKYINKMLVTIGYTCVFFTILQMIFPSIVNSLVDLLYSERSAWMHHYYASSKHSYYGICPTSYENSLLCSFALFDAIISILSKKKTKSKYYIVLMICILSIVATQKRGIILSALVAIIVYLAVFYFDRSESLRAKVAITFLAIFACFGIIWFLNFSVIGNALVERLVFNGEDISTSGRSEIYSTLLNDIDKNVWFGHGSGATYGVISIGAHNIYIQLLYDNGIIGLSIFVIFFLNNLISAYSIIKTADEEYKPIVTFSFICQVVYITYGFSGNPLYYTNTLLLYGLYLSMKENIKQFR